MLQGEHSALLSTFTKLPLVIKTFVLSIFEWPFYTGFTVFDCIYSLSLPSFFYNGNSYTLLDNLYFIIYWSSNVRTTSVLIQLNESPHDQSCASIFGSNLIQNIHIILCKPIVLSPLRSLRVRNEVDLVPLACEDEKNVIRLTNLIQP